MVRPVGSPYSDLDRPPLSAARLTRALVQPGSRWTRVDVVARTGSTNADVIARARDGEPEGYVLVAEQQTAGRGRLGRPWQSPPRAGLAVSFLLRPDGIAVSRYGWLPLLIGTAVIEAVATVTQIAAGLKWPNDVLVRDRKAGGILVEAVPTEVGSPAVVVGLGLNVTLKVSELPAPEATSLAIAGAAHTDRDPLLREILRAVQRGYDRWVSADGDADRSGLRGSYRAACVTLGRSVRVHLPGEQVLTGIATDIDSAGQLMVVTDDGVRTVAAGDVVHVRPTKTSDR